MQIRCLAIPKNCVSLHNLCLSCLRGFEHIIIEKVNPNAISLCSYYK